ncbi:MAG: hypothetical protein FWD71_19485 [Oscillospiraceae bacterium]|nr:hypothetical protein [Oscillospiraceae bacterium]
MPKQDTQKDVKVIIQYENNTESENKNVESLQEVMQKLFNAYIIRTIQNIKKGK